MKICDTEKNPAIDRIFDFLHLPLFITVNGKYIFKKTCTKHTIYNFVYIHYKEVKYMYMMCKIRFLYFLPFKTMTAISKHTNCIFLP